MKVISPHFVTNCSKLQINSTIATSYIFWHSSINASALPMEVLLQFQHLPSKLAFLLLSLPTLKYKNSLIGEMGLQANIMCSGVWCNHPLLPNSIILPSKKKSHSSCCQCRQMRPPHINTRHYQHNIFFLFCFMTALCT